MQIQLDIRFEQLLQIVRTLPVSQQQLLKVELEKNATARTVSDLGSLLLSGPVATEEQIAVIENNRKEVNQWRTE